MAGGTLDPKLHSLIAVQTTRPEVILQSRRKLLFTLHRLGAVSVRFTFAVLRLKMLFHNTR